jgi:anti-sigma B factor antagonist
MPQLDCELLPVTARPGTAVVALHGAIDPKSVSTLAAAIGGAAGKGFRTLILDLGDVRYINSAGLSYLVTLSDAMTGRGGALHLANAQPKVKVVFDLMGVTSFFKLHKTVQAALTALGAVRRVPRRRLVARQKA